MNILGVTFLEIKSGKALARADVHFEGFLLKGFKIGKDLKTGKEYVMPPSYKSAMGWRPLFKTDTLEDWHSIQERILKEYNEKQINESMQEN